MAIQFEAKMVFLGAQMKVSGKTQKPYQIVKLFNAESAEVFDFYVAGDNMAMVTSVAQCVPMTEVEVLFEMTGFNGKAGVELKDLAIAGKKK